MLLQITEPEESNTPNAPTTNTGAAIGIDLGTTYTVAAFVSDGKTRVIDFSSADESNEGASKGTLLPSVVEIQGQMFSSFKRHMDSPATQIDGVITPVELSAKILLAVKERAAAAMGQEVSQAVITVPAYFGETARQATKDAAEIAGLKVLRLVNEPTAAALAYGLDNKSEGIYAIYDLGGGTFDFSLLKMKGGVFQVLATSGDTHLGGDDVDCAIANHWGHNADQGADFKGILKLSREAKEALSVSENWHKGELKLSRDELESIANPLVNKTILVCDKALKDAKIPTGGIKGVVLVGGSTRLGAVRKAVADFFGREPLTNLDPDQIVAIGAALQADILTGGNDSLLLDLTPLSLGLETIGGLVEKIIHRNSAIPTFASQEFTTYHTGQSTMKIHVLQGEGEKVEDCRSLGEFILTNIPPMEAGKARIEVTFAMDVDGILTVKAQEKTTGINQVITVKPSYGLTLEQLKEMLKQQ